MQHTINGVYDQNEWEMVRDSVDHPTNPTILRGTLLRNRRTGRYVILCGQSYCSCPQGWARGEAAKDEKIAACQVVRCGKKFSVTSPSGGTYTVSTSTRIDEMGSLYFSYSCDCAARGRCVHIDAVEKFRIDEELNTDSGDGLSLIDRS